MQASMNSSVWTTFKQIAGRLSRHARPWRAAAIAVAALCQSAASPARAPISQYVQTTFTTADGLPQASIKSIDQTRDGYLWLATQEGLVRYDGEHFTTFTTRGNPGLISNNIHKIVEDTEGNLWIHASFGVCRLRGGVFTDFTPHAGDGGSNRVHDIFLGNDGRMYVLTDNRFYRWAHDKFVEAINFTNLTGVSGWPEPEFETTPDGDLYFSNLSRIYRVRHGDYHELEALSAGSYGSMAYSHGRIWVSGKGLYWLTEDGRLQDATPKEIAGNAIGQIEAASDGDLWMQVDHELMRLRPADPRAQIVARYPLGSLRLGLFKGQSGGVWGCTERQPKNAIVSCGPRGAEFCPTGSATPMEWRSSPILRDREGVVWVGTRDGLECRRPLLNHTLYSGRQLPNGEVRCVLVNRRGETWVGTGGAGLGRLQGDLWIPAPLPMLRTKSIDALCEDGRGGMWVSTEGRLYDWDLAKTITDVTPQFALSMAKPAGSTLGSFSSILQDGHGGVWIAGPDLFHYDARRRVQRYGLTDPSFGSRAFSICLDGADGVWVSGGVGVGHLSGGKLHWFGVESGLPSVPIIDFLREPDGSLWMGTWGAGIVRYAHGRFHTISAMDGLYADSIHKILQASDGTLYINSSKGVFSVTENELRRYADGQSTSFVCMPIGAPDGVDAGAGAAATSPAGAALPDGGYLFPGEHGLARIIPQQATTEKKPTVIEDAYLNGVPTQTNRAATMRAGEGSAKFRFACLSYTHAGAFRYWYRLEGFDTTWTEAAEDHSVRYTNLPPGRYTFRVMVREGSGSAVIGAARFAFTLEPHFYEALWFRILMALLLICAPIAGMTLRSRSLRRANQILEAGVAERTRAVELAHKELRAMHEEVVAQNEAMLNVQTEMEAQNEELVRAQVLLEQQNARLETLATTDGLTGLTNHRTFQERLEAEWRRAGRYGAPLAMILLDVDHFKQYNDTFGHPEGDVVLKQVAEIVRSQARDTDIVARYGGEEFALILPQTDQLAAFHLAERIRAAIETQSWPRRPVTVSLGVSAVRMDIYAPVDLVTRADTALYESKHRGRNRTTMSTSKHSEAAA